MGRSEYRGGDRRCWERRREIPARNEPDCPGAGRRGAVRMGVIVIKKILSLAAIFLISVLFIAAVQKPAPGPLYLYERDDLYGYMDRQGYIVIGPQYRIAKQFREGLAGVVRMDGNTFEYVDYIDNQGRTVISDNRFHASKPGWFDSFHEGIAIVDTDTRWSGQLLIDKRGRLVTDRVFKRSIFTFSEGYAACSNLLPYAAPVPGSERMIRASYLNTEGELATEKWFNETRSFSNGLAVVGRWKDGDIRFFASDKQYAVINRDFQLVTDYRFEEAGSYRDGRLAVMMGGKWGYIDGQGNQLIACKYDPYNGVEGGQYLSIPEPLELFLRDADTLGLYDFSEGLASIYQDGKWGYINTSGELVIPLQFELARPFSEGLAAVKQDGKWGFIDQTGKVMISPQYDYVLNFQDGLAVVGDQDGSYKCYIDQDGQKIRNRAKRS